MTKTEGNLKFRIGVWKRRRRCAVDPEAAVVREASALKVLVCVTSYFAVIPILQALRKAVGQAEMRTGSEGICKGLTATLALIRS